jgi:hypothetical protein
LEVNLRKAPPGDAVALGHIQVTSWRSAFRNIASDEYLDHHVSEENHPSRKFYEALGGELAGKHQIELGDRELSEVAYGWKDIHHLEKFE